MSEPQSPDLHHTLRAYEHVRHFERSNVVAICDLGHAFQRLDRATESRECYKMAVEALMHAIRTGNAEAALAYETLIHNAFVSTVENEDHYYRCYSTWRKAMVRLGRQYYQPSGAPDVNPGCVGFVLQTGVILGHTEVLFNLLEYYRPASEQDRVAIKLYVLFECDASFLERARRLGLEPVLAEAELPGGPDTPCLTRFHWLRERLRRDDCGIMVWVTYQPTALFALSMRLAPVQIFWALRFHTISGPWLDGYITWGARDEQVRHYFGQDWQVAPMPFAVDTSPPPRLEVEKLRARFREPLLLGTLAREDKLNSPPFLQAVADILLQHPHACYLWTGRSEHAGIAEYFRRRGVSDRCHFVGWVDTRLYAAALDVFLDTFPHGCGVTSYQAFSAGVPLLSYLDPYTMFGTHFWQSASADKTANGAGKPRLSAPDQFPILCASDPAEYVTLAGRLISDPAWRVTIGSRGRAFFEDELANFPAYAERFFSTISRIAKWRLGGSTPGRGS